MKEFPIIAPASKWSTAVMGGLFALAAVACLAALATWYFMQPKPVVETPAAAVEQPDGSVVVERKPDATAKPKQAVPKGAKVERVGSITVKPAATPDHPVTVDWSLVRLGDNSKRVVASSPDGQVIGGVDIPVETAEPPPPPKLWAAGISYNPSQQTPGVWIERDVGRVRLGVDINQIRPVIAGPSDIEARLRLGVTF